MIWLSQRVVFHLHMKRGPHSATFTIEPGQLNSYLTSSELKVEEHPIIFFFSPVMLCISYDITGKKKCNGQSHPRRNEMICHCKLSFADCCMATSTWVCTYEVHVYIYHFLKLQRRQMNNIIRYNWRLKRCDCHLAPPCPYGTS